MEAIAVDSLLESIEEEASSRLLRDIIGTAREELQRMSSSLQWAHMMISFYASEHGKKIAGYVYSGDREAFTEKFARNDQMRLRLEEMHPWLAFAAPQVPTDVKAELDRYLQTIERAQRIMEEKWPTPPEPQPAPAQEPLAAEKEYEEPAPRITTSDYGIL